ncbi:MAG: hypothetical protein Q4G68_14035 [Planctomycetia bacterium]|nr:hypothetical protein [Planctomycetia bacterium]
MTQPEFAKNDKKRISCCACPLRLVLSAVQTSCGLGSRPVRDKSSKRASLGCLIILLLCIFSGPTVAIENENWSVTGSDATGWSVQLRCQGQPMLQTPEEGLWSVALSWKDNAPDDWHHVKATSHATVGNWHILSGTLDLPQGQLLLRDSWRLEGDLLRCTRRFEYKGTGPVENVTLTVRCRMTGEELDAFLPGILYYGNPSGEKNGVDRVPVWHGHAGEFAIFEEHRYPMPFACLENRQEHCAAALHTVPSPVVGAAVRDQWWSCGVQSSESNASELVLYSGYMGYNGHKSVAKATQTHPLSYPQSTLTLAPDTVIEKTFRLDLWPVAESGSGFMQPVERTLQRYKPTCSTDMPSRDDIILSKAEFARSRWLESEHYAGFNMYPPEIKEQIVMGWCGQAAAPGYALIPLTERIANSFSDPEQGKAFRDWSIKAVQKSLDHLATSPINENGFSVEYDPKTCSWRPISDPVSMGQALYNIARAVAAARNDARYKTQLWEQFLRDACEVHAKRILRDDWASTSTAEAFYIAPLILAADLLNSDSCRAAAEKAANHFAERHLDMREPYWGGTLDATCEDKEGAWAAFQGFLAMYESTHEEKYLRWARHACDVCLSYLVVWDIPLPPGRLADHAFLTRGWTGVSPQNQHLDVYGVLFAPEVRRLGQLLANDAYCDVAELMFRSCGQLTDPYGSQGEQIQQTNFAQRGDLTDLSTLRGGYAEHWTVFWITAHFLVSAAKDAEYNFAESEGNAHDSQ